MLLLNLEPKSLKCFFPITLVYEKEKKRKKRKRGIGFIVLVLIGILCQIHVFFFFFEDLPYFMFLVSINVTIFSS